VIALLIATALAADARFPVRGVMTDDVGARVPDGEVDLRLTLYAADATPLWTDVQTVEVSDGRFTVTLGAATPLDTALFADRLPQSLGVGLPDGDDLGIVTLSTAPWVAFADHVRDADTVGGADLDDVAATAISEEEVRALVRGSCLDPSDDLLAFTDAIYQPDAWVPSWAAIVGLPPGLADGTDDGLTSPAAMEGWFEAEFDTTPDTIPDDGVIATGEVDDGISIDNDVLTALAGQPPVAHVPVQLTYGGTIDKHLVTASPDKVGVVVRADPEAVERLCRTATGCRAVLTMSGFDPARPGEVAAREGVLHYSSTNRRWNLDAPGADVNGFDGNGDTTEWTAWDCILTDAETSTSTNNGREDEDDDGALGLLNVKGGDWPDATTTCRLVLEAE